MLKRIVTLILAVCIMFATSFVFANNAGTEAQSSLDKAGNSVKNVVDNAGNVVRDGVGHLENGIEDLGNTFSAGASRVANPNNNNNNNNRTYTTAKTSTGSPTFAGMNATTWVWFVMAIATVAIVAVVWYYAMQNDVKYRKNNND